MKMEISRQKIFRIENVIKKVEQNSRLFILVKKEKIITNPNLQYGDSVMHWLKQRLICPMPNSLPLRYIQRWNSLEHLPVPMKMSIS